MVDDLLARLLRSLLDEMEETGMEVTEQDEIEGIPAPDLTDVMIAAARTGRWEIKPGAQSLDDKD